MNDVESGVIEIMKKKKGEDIVLLDISEVSSVTDAFIICTAKTVIQSRTIVDTINEELEEAGINPHHIEGYEVGRWILMDYLDFVIHVFLPRERDYYNLERLWGDVPKEVYKDETGN